MGNVLFLGDHHGISVAESIRMALIRQIGTIEFPYIVIKMNNNNLLCGEDNGTLEIL